LRDLGDHRTGARPGGENIVRLLPLRGDKIMESRITIEQVTFRRPFTLSGLQGIQPPGTYTIRTEEQMLETSSFVGWRQAGTMMVLHRSGGVEYAVVDRQELREALVHDGDQGTDPPASPAVAASLGGRRRRK
jgi:hypothetical protein